MFRTQFFRRQSTMVIATDVLDRRGFLQIVGLLLCWLAVPGVSAAAEPPEFPRELVEFTAASENPVFSASGPGHWDARIRERGWIMREGDLYRMWYTGYDGTRAGQKKLGYASSADGLHWTRHPQNPIYDADWVEDLMIVKHDGTYYMFAEGADDQSQLLTSTDGLKWTRQGTLDVRLKDGRPIEAGPFGTPTAWLEDGTWYLFYERRDAGIWLATSSDLKIWTNLQDEPVLRIGPDHYDRKQIALNQIVKHNSRYYAYYHGSAGDTTPGLWSTSVAVSSDLIHWKKYAGNPLFPIGDNKSSGILIHDGQRYRLYTMHDRVDVHFHEKK